MSCYFKDHTYLERALRDAECRPESTHTTGEAFLLLLKGATFRQLENLCTAVSKAYGITPEDSWLQIQGHGPLGDTDGKTAEELLAIAFGCLDGGNALGTELIPGRTTNTSDWMGHSLLEGRLAGKLAQALGLDRDTGRKLGFLHDYGRKLTHTFDHTVRGFELLTDLGWDFEAVGCLTHSYLNGERCANMERAEPGFYVDGEGTPRWGKEHAADDMCLFLDSYRYTDYDHILNIADLMATSRAVVSPAERVADIATRRVLDERNYPFFLAEITNLLNLFNTRLRGLPEPVRKVMAAEGVAEGELRARFEQASAEFFRTYLKEVKHSFDE